MSAAERKRERERIHKLANACPQCGEQLRIMPARLYRGRWLVERWECSSAGCSYVYIEDHKEKA